MITVSNMLIRKQSCMSQSDFDVLFKQSYEAAKDLITRDFDDSFLEKYQNYSFYIDQLVELLDTIPEKSEHIVSQTKNLLAEHKKVLNRLENEKTEIGKKISDKICNEHIRQKYTAKSIQSALLNKKI